MNYEFLDKEGLKHYNDLVREKHKDDLEKLDKALDEIHKTDVQELGNKISALKTELNAVDEEIKKSHLKDIEDLKTASSSLSEQLTILEDANNALATALSDAVKDVDQKIQSAIGNSSTDVGHTSDTSIHFTKAEMKTEISKDLMPGQFLGLVGNQLTGIDLVTEVSVATNAEELAERKSTKPMTLQDVFNSWYRFAHNPNYVQYNSSNYSSASSDIQSAMRAWSFDSSKNAIKNSINTVPYVGYISDKEYTNYSLRIKGVGTDSDDDQMSIIVGFMKDTKGKEHHISVIRNGGSQNSGPMSPSGTGPYQFSIMYDFNCGSAEWRGVYVLATFTGTLTKNQWSSSAKISVTRQGNKIIADTTQMGGTDFVAQISYELPKTKPSDMTDEIWENINTMLNNPSKIGFGMCSQPGYFILEETKGIFDNSDIWDIQNDTVYSYTTKWEPISSISEKINSSFIYSKDHKKLFYFKEGKIVFSLSTD